MPSHFIFTKDRYGVVLLGLVVTVEECGCRPGFMPMVHVDTRFFKGFRTHESG